MAKRLELIGSVRGNLTWATVMAWALLPETSPDEGPTLVLAIGSSDGSVVLCAAPAATLAAARLVEGASGEELMSRLPPAILPDLRLVSAMDLCLRYPVVSGEQRSSSPQLVIAVGKSMGTVCVWTSERLPTTPPTGKGKAAASDAGGGILEALGKGSLLMPPRIGALASLGTSTVTGIACTAAGELVVACSRDGAVNSWSLATPGGAAGGGKLQACPPPVPCVRRKSKDVGFGAFGVAGSPGGAFMAVYRLALPPGIHFVK